MRTKMLVFAAAAMTAGFLTAYAQTPVYSVNTVGYVNLYLTNGFTMMANQLDVDGYGTNNTVQTVFGTQLSNGATIFAFQNGAFATPAATYSKKSGWSGNTTAVNAALNAGGGLFIQVPAATSVTIAGNVLQGNLTNNYAAGFNILASQVPQGGAVQTALGLTPSGSATLIRYNPTNQAYITPAYTFSKKSGWSPSEPVLNVGEAFWMQSGASGQWTRNFTVN